MKDNKSDLLMNRTDNLEFEDLFNLQDIQKIQDDFANALGIASIITKPDGTPITNPSNFCRLCGDIIRKTEKGLADCIRSNAISEKSYHDGPVLRKCLGCGLWDAGTSMFVGGQHIANWLIGQIRDEDLSEDNIIEYANHIGVDEKVVVEAFREIPVMSLEKLNDKLSLLHSFSQQISNTAFQNLMQAQLIESMNETENALSKNEEEIQSIFRAAPAGIGVVCNRILTKVNDQLCEMIGYSKEELLGHSSRVLYPNEEEFNYVGREKYSQIKSEGTGSVETKFLCKDGRIIDVLLSSTPLDFQDFEKGVTFTVLDITYLKNKEKELLESERKYRTMLEVMEDPVYICSTDMTVEYMNPAMEKIIGSNMQGKKCYAAVFGHDSQCPWCIYDKIKKDKDMTFDIRNPKNNRDYHISCSPIVHLNNETSMLAILRDVTDFKLLHSNLQQSQKMESIGTLAGGIAHDFNNILSPIIGYVELAKDNLPFESQEQSYLSEVLKATDRASELVRQILTFSRNSEFELKPISPHKIVTEALKLIRASLPSTIEVKYQPGVKDNLIMADSTQILQIVMNLCTNAFHAMEDKGGLLRISLDEVDIPLEKARILEISPGKYFSILVADTGHGMEPEIIKRIFDPYFTTKSKEKGTGLGLAITHGLVRDYSGAIEVTSTPGEGTEFILYFPLIQNNSVLPSKKDEIAPKFGDERILIVDDEFAIVNMEREMLELLGYQVTTRTSSIEALELFRKQPDKFDLVITDLTMPYLTGIDLIKSIIDLRSNIRFILCTGNREAITNKAIESMGEGIFLEKPISLKVLSHVIRTLFDK